MNNYAPFQTAEKVCRARAREETKAKKRKEEGKKERHRSTTMDGGEKKSRRGAPRGLIDGCSEIEINRR